MIWGILLAVVGAAAIGTGFLGFTGTYRLVLAGIGVLLLLGGVLLGISGFNKNRAENQSKLADAKVRAADADPGTFERRQAASVNAYNSCYSNAFDKAKWPNRAKKARAACAHLAN